MAISGDIVTQGNLVATGAYLRISDVIITKITEGINKGKWRLQYGVDCYVNADERAKDDPQTLAAKQVGRYWLISDTEPSDPYAVAYADLKIQSSVANASDLV
tara:strand:+ start:788 stop:1096 length:309 start_codon:yes stop_codon:yes gene_type:complete